MSCLHEPFRKDSLIPTSYSEKTSLAINLDRKILIRFKFRQVVLSNLHLLVVTVLMEGQQTSRSGHYLRLMAVKIIGTVSGILFRISVYYSMYFLSRSLVFIMRIVTFSTSRSVFLHRQLVLNSTATIVIIDFGGRHRRNRISRHIFFRKLEVPYTKNHALRVYLVFKYELPAVFGKFPQETQRHWKVTQAHQNRVPFSKVILINY